MNEDATPPRAVGRPRDLEKRDALLDAAWQLFLTEGVQAVPLDAIARQAGVSRVTLYSHFPDKTALFEAVMSREMTRLAASQQPRPAGVPLRDGLVAFGCGLMRFLTRTDVINFYSVLAGELRRHPDLARRFYDLGPGQTHRNLAAMIETAIQQSELAAASPQDAAENLIGMWQGLASYKLPLGVGVDELVARIEIRVSDAVDVFLAAYRA